LKELKTEITTLKNGAKIIGIKMPSSKSVVINFGFRVGSRDEDPKYAGISHFLEHMMFKGSEKRPSAAAIAKEADRIGARYNAFTGKEYTCYYIKTSKKDFDLGLDLVGDMITKPLLDNAELNKEKGTIIEEIKMYNDNPMINIYGKMEETLYGTKNQMGRDIAGKIKTVKAIDSKVMGKYFSKNYVGANCVLVIAGDLPENYLTKSRAYLNRLSRGEKNERSVEPLPKSKARIITKPTEQAHFGLCIPGFSICQKDKYAAEIIATALGGYMSARLFTEIREKRGWAYSIKSYHDTNSDSGYLGIVGGIKKDKIIDAISLVKTEISGFKDNFTEEEIERAKSHLLGSFTLKYDDSEARATYIVLDNLLADTEETPENFISKIQKVRPEEIKKVAEKLFSDKNLYLTVIGPYQNKEKFAKILTR
jgi:predicted Zn-dependent peptidase